MRGGISSLAAELLLPSTRSHSRRRTRVSFSKNTANMSGTSSSATRGKHQRPLLTLGQLLPPSVRQCLKDYFFEDAEDDDELVESDLQRGLAQHGKCWPCGRSLQPSLGLMQPGSAWRSASKTRAWPGSSARKGNMSRVLLGSSRRLWFVA